MLLRLFISIFALLLLVGCQPIIEDDVQIDALQKKLDGAFGNSLLKIKDFRAMGNGAFNNAADDRLHVIVYYSALISFEKDYEFGDWDSVNAKSLQLVIGAGNDGIKGIQVGGNKTGDILTVYGSMPMVMDGEQWLISNIGIEQAQGDQGIYSLGQDSRKVFLFGRSTPVS